VYATGTAYIFESRARSIRKRLNNLTFAGLVLPVAVGAVVIAYGASVPRLSLIIGIAAGLGALQLIVALWSVVQGWPDSLEAATRSLLANRALAQEFDSLAKNPPSSAPGLGRQLSLLVARDDHQRLQDHAQGILEKEKRKGLRAALLRYDRQCAKCHFVPPNMKPTRCGVCGDF
jgi:mobilome CxxCx(11)CxxC protein